VFLLDYTEPVSVHVSTYDLLSQYRLHFSKKNSVAKFPCMFALDLVDGQEEIMK
jgi:hypothetical protein